MNEYFKRLSRAYGFPFFVGLGILIDKVKKPFRRRKKYVKPEPGVRSVVEQITREINGNH